MHTLLLSAWWSSVLSPVLGLSVRSDTPSISAVRIEHTVMRIEQLPPDDVHTVIDDPPNDPTDDPAVTLLSEPAFQSMFPDVAWFDSVVDDRTAFTIRARRPLQEPAPREPAVEFQPTSAPELVAVHADPQPASDNRAPRYPGVARRLNWEGRVVLRVAVDLSGAVTAVTVTRSSGRELLDQAALEAVRAWRFEPAHASGVPMAGETDVSVRFELEG